MSRIPHLLARITARTSSRPTLPRQPLSLSRALSTTPPRPDEHNLSSPSRPQQTSPPTPATHPTYFAAPKPDYSSRNFYRTHGRALFKTLTLAFFTYQVLYWAWLTLETEEIKHGKNEEIGRLESEVRVLVERRKGEKRVLEVGETK
jgi:hypothetical protein